MKTTALLTVAGLTFASAVAAQSDVLTVYAPDYFGSEWGPGPSIEAAFEAQCDCDLQYQTGDVLPRLLLEGTRTEADVVIGLNTDVTKRARESGLLGLHSVDLSALTLPIEWSDDVFVPFNYSHTAFIYDNTKLDGFDSFEDLLNAPDDVRVVIQDPRSSTPGLGLLLWVKDAYGDRAPEIWEGLADNIVTVTKGWSEAYGMFLEGEADMVLSYTTSPAYHLIAEEDASKAAAVFNEGHYMQVEVAGKVAGTDVPELADQFMAFMVSEAFQTIIPTTNWMYPAATQCSSCVPAAAPTIKLEVTGAVQTASSK